ncbi:acyloxyacyl hydrolase [Arsenicitalea aurantiaca]|uniref:acyloxyacyl hydrolase n=1 Tax=Arsenicitalea aurantiaca TaxID=1783274 RepID=UPI0013152558|nr:acyloxyacyl hydrolase [Arsenicitalea aurantiaca]
MRTIPALSLAFGALVVLALPAQGQDPVSLSEVRVGGAISGIELLPWFAPDLETFTTDNLDSLTVDFLFHSEDLASIDWLGAPRLELGGVLNVQGRESVLHAGLNWQVPVFETPLFAELGLGVGIHDGALDGAERPLRNLGCPFGFHYSYALGANLENNFTILAKFQHISHANLCGDRNDGINNFGLSAGYRF